MENVPSLDQLFALRGRVALVTGASRGLGRAMACGLAGAGAHVYVNSRDPAAVGRVAETIRAAGFAATALAFDVEDPPARAKAINTIGKTERRLDILVSNAGKRHRVGVAEIGEDAFNSMFANHVTSALMLSKLAVPLMRRNNYGRIIMTTSIVAARGRAGDVGYIAAKGALSALTRALACEYGAEGITCNAIAPGLFATDVNQGFVSDPAVLAEIQATTPLRRYAEEWEIAGATIFLASPSSAFMTGQVMVIDGGRTIRV